jgi:uncharacterized membrane protein
MIDQFAQLADGIGLALGVATAAVLIVGSSIALFKFVSGLLFEKHRPGEDLTDHHVNPIRVEFGRYITFALEFLIAKDIIETLFTPEWEDVGQLAALVVIRTIIGLFLMYEIEKIEKRSK